MNNSSIKYEMERFYPIVKIIRSNEKYSDGWTLERYLLEMDMSDLYVLKNRNVEGEYVLKFMSVKREELETWEYLLLKEVETQEKAALVGIAPELIEAWVCEKGYVIVMRKLGKTVSDLFKEYTSFEVKQTIVLNVLKVIRMMHQNEIYHGDTHTENFMVMSNTKDISNSITNEKEKYDAMNYKYYVIDFGSTDGANVRDDYTIFACFLKCFFTNSELISIFSPLNIFDKEDLKICLIKLMN